MMEPISILIADDNIEYGNLLHEYINKFEDLKVVGIARDGIEAVDMIKDHTPNIVVLDIIMPNLDGIGVLEKISEMQPEKKPLSIMLSAVGQDVFVQKAISLGAEYYIIKPFDVDILITRIRQIYNDKRVSSIALGYEIQKPAVNNTEPEKDENYLEITVSNILQSLGIPPHLTGYQYIREAILISINDSLAHNFITKTLYPTIAGKFKTNSCKVERAIRMAINYAWKKERLSGSKEIPLLGTITFEKDKPSNSRFISTLSEKIRIQISTNSNYKTII